VLSKLRASKVLEKAADSILNYSDRSSIIDNTMIEFE
jgi:hypothetical protein